MTLRLRLTLFYTLLVALILILSGVALHVFLAQSLVNGIDESLEESANVVAAVVENVDGSLRIRSSDEVASQFSGDLVAILYDASGSVVERLGDVPEGVPRLETEYATWQAWRTYRRPLEGGALTVLRELVDMRETLRRFDLLYLVLAPFAVGVAFLLGYALAGRALAPVDRLTRAAYALASRLAWRERLPEPKQRDELQRLAKGTNALLAALESVIESERRFTADAAHELRTPLALLQGRLEKGIEQADDPVKARAAFGVALEANAKLLNLIEKLLRLARAESGQELHKERLALDEIAFSVAAQVRPALTEKGLELHLELPEDPVFVFGDRTSLELAVRNLLDNARKFTPKGVVTLTVYARDAEVYLAVTDSGPGLAEDALPHLFDRFYQTDVRHRQTGSGLGLAIVRSVAQWHGGDVRAENLSKGARFVLTLPAYTE